MRALLVGVAALVLGAVVPPPFTLPAVAVVVALLVALAHPAVRP